MINAILGKVLEVLTAALITNIPADDPALAGIVAKGELQGDPEPDTARIAVTLHWNDPDAIFKPGSSGINGSWEDEIAEVECGGSVTWKRGFTIKARALLVETQEDKAAAMSIASTLRTRIEHALLNISFAGVAVDGEFVSKGFLSQNLRGETVLAGGPDAYDVHIKVRFQVETTTGVTP